MADLKDIQQQLRSLRSDRDGTEANLRRNQQQAQKLDKQIDQLERQGDNHNAQGMLDQSPGNCWSNYLTTRRSCCCQ
ncbi:MAG: hypothetical protein IPM82_10240 [Saprospiraceae bacterium]|nr:hypothetical protein [Saprospiraceae bacterium]